MEILDSGQIQNRPMIFAGFWIRFAAAILDGIIMYIIQAIITLAFFGSLFIGGNGVFPPLYNILMLFGGTLIVNWLYYAGMESSANQATLGKKAVGIKVTDTQGNQISFGRATGRYFSKFISALIFLIGYIMAGFTEKKQALHDMIAGTYVVNK